MRCRAPEKMLAAGDQPRDFGTWLDLCCQYRRRALIDGHRAAKPKRIAWGIFVMNEPTITCPHCKAEIKVTEPLAAPLIRATRKKIAEKEAEVARRERGIGAQRAELAKAVESIEQQFTTRLKTERERIARDLCFHQTKPCSADGAGPSHLTPLMAKRNSQTARLLPQGSGGALQRFRNIFDGSLAFRILPQFPLILCGPLPTYNALHLPTRALSHSSLLTS
jgi:hypothetical protein